MRDLRTGECLWSEWTGEGLSAQSEEPSFFTQGHIDVENEIVRRALASSLQRDGIVHSLGGGFKSIESAEVIHGYAGTVDGDTDFCACDSSGETRAGDVVDEVLEVTWVVF
jgi:hypothetical protein